MKKNIFLIFLKVVLIIVSGVFLTSSFSYNDSFEVFEEDMIEVNEYNLLSPEILSLQDKIKRIIDSYDEFDYDLSLKIISCDNSQVFYEYQPNKALIPASNLKLITTAFAFDQLNPDFRWKTDFYQNPSGKLYIKASGDPSWNDSFKRGMINQITKSIADSLKIRGIHHVMGDIIIDPGTFHDYQMGFGWKDENRIHTYSAKPSVIAFNDNSVQVRINPTSNGKIASITLYPVNSGFKIINNVKTTNNRRMQGFDFSTDHLSNTITIQGNIWERSKTQYRSLAVPRPDLFAINIFKEKLLENNIRLNGHVYYKSISDNELFTEQYDKIFSIFSVPLKEVVAEINKNSNNFMANQVFLTLGERNLHVWQTENFIRQWLANNNIPIKNLKMYDGSGLSSYNTCTTDVFTGVLKIMYDSEYFSEFYNSLAISGRDGTLRNSFNNALLNRNVYAKTGYISGARALSGYIKTADSEILAFSFIINKENSRIRNFNNFMERILAELATFSRETNQYTLKIYD